MICWRRIPFPCITKSILLVGFLYFKIKTILWTPLSHFKRNIILLVPWKPFVKPQSRVKLKKYTVCLTNFTSQWSLGWLNQYHLGFQEFVEFVLRIRWRFWVQVWVYGFEGVQGFGGVHGSGCVEGFGNIIIIKGDNISVHYNYFIRLTVSKLSLLK
jgi:hypothetical protein